MAQSGCLPFGRLLITVRRQSATRRRCGGSCPSAVRTTPSACQGCSGHRQVGRHPLAVVHGFALSNGWRRTWTSARIKCHTGSPSIVGLQAHVHQAECLLITQREFRHAKVKHPAAKQGLLVLIGCSFSPQPNFSVNGTPTSLLASARPCGRPLPRALGFHTMRWLAFSYSCALLVGAFGAFLISSISEYGGQSSPGCNLYDALIYGARCQGFPGSLAVSFIVNFALLVVQVSAASLSSPIIAVLTIALWAPVIYVLYLCTRWLRLRKPSRHVACPTSR